jgi:hypothetical protein
MKIREGTGSPIKRHLSGLQIAFSSLLKTALPFIRKLAYSHVRFGICSILKAKSSKKRGNA